jgi:hypothetical protein
VKKAVEIVKKHGYLKVLDERELVLEMETERNYEELEKELQENFKDQLNLERI